MKDKIDLVKEWFQKADNDILAIENNLKAEKVPTDTVCFHSQQAAEKYLKGYLRYNEVEFEYRHDLIYLIELAEPKNKAFRELVQDLKKLNKYAVEIRYPYFYIPTLEEAKEAFESAKKVKDFVLDLLKGKLENH